jgi:biotin synthase
MYQPYYSVAHIAAQEHLSEADIRLLLSLEKPRDLEMLFQIADELRQYYVGDDVHLRGIIEFSNICRRNCDYCGLRHGNSKIVRYRMDETEILESVEKIDQLGIPTVVLQSGEDMHWTRSRVTDLIKAIKSRYKLAITLSLGERDAATYRQWFEAGADRYLLKIETTNPALYKKIHPDCTFAERVRCQKELREIGYQLGSGFMIGLPGQTITDLAKDIYHLQEIGADMAGMGPFIPDENTPLANAAAGTVEMTLKVLAAARLLTKVTHLPATTALETLSPGGRIKALKAGANVIMPNFTPMKYRENYAIYPNKAGIKMTPDTLLEKIKSEISSIGRHIATNPGHSLRNQWKKH